jgi:hypothetical protein
MKQTCALFTKPTGFIPTTEAFTNFFEATVSSQAKTGEAPPIHLVVSCRYTDENNQVKVKVVQKLKIAKYRSAANAVRHPDFVVDALRAAAGLGINVATVRGITVKTGHSDKHPILIDVD